MSNALVDVRFVVDVPEDKLVALVGRSDDGSDGWYQESADAAEGWVRDNLAEALELAGEPDVECES